MLEILQIVWSSSMKLIIKNQDNETFEITITKKQMETIKIRDILKEIFDNNIILKENLSFEDYEKLLQLSLHGKRLEANFLVKDQAFDDESELHLSLINPISMS